MSIVSGFEVPEGDDEDAEIRAARESWANEPDADALTVAVNFDMMVTIAIAQRYEHVEFLRRDAYRTAAAHGYQNTELIARGLRLELSTAMGVTEYAAGMLLSEAESLVNRYPNVLRSLRAVRITPRHATDLVAALDALDAEMAHRLVSPLLDLAESLPVGKFQRKMRHLIETTRAATLTERHEQALRERRLYVEATSDGMGWLHLHAPIVELHAIHTRITQMATTGRDDESRTVDHVRADVACDLLLDTTPTTLPPEARGIRPTVFLTVPALTLLNTPGTEESPATVEGIGPIPLERARELAGTATGWTRILTHPETGMILSVGRDRYRPPPDLRRLTQWRAETCMAPGCTTPASRCQIDHTLAWDHGGTTALTNHAPLCSAHHHVKHGTDWTVHQHPDGTLTWTSPAGRHYNTHPERRIPTFTSSDPAPF